MDAVLIPGGFGVRGVDGKIGAARWARENKVPTLGICLGLQVMVMEYARTMLGLEGASSSEFDPDTPHPVIATMEEQLEFVEGKGDLGGTMRLGEYRAVLTPGSVVEQTYGAAMVGERHRHRYEVNNAYRAQLEEAGLVVSGESPDRQLVEFIELPREAHPYYVATQAHPEFLSRPTKAHPLFAGLIGAALARQRGCQASAGRNRSTRRPRRDVDAVSDPGAGEIADLVAPRPIIARHQRFEGRVWDLVSDEVDLGHSAGHPRLPAAHRCCRDCGAQRAGRDLPGAGNTVTRWESSAGSPRQDCSMWRASRRWKPPSANFMRRPI